MNKKVLVISTTLRNGGNSLLLADEFARGAKDGGNTVEVVNLIGKKIEFCNGCLGCQNTQKCHINDDTIEIAEKMLTAEVVVFATPVYYYSMCGQMKTLLDRMNPLFSANYAFSDIYLIATAADTDKRAIDGTITGLQGWIDCFDNASLKGVVRGVGVTDIGDISAKTELLAEAYSMGKSV